MARLVRTGVRDWEVIGEFFTGRVYFIEEDNVWEYYCVDLQTQRSTLGGSDFEESEAMLMMLLDWHVLEGKAKRARERNERENLG